MADLISSIVTLLGLIIGFIIFNVFYSNLRKRLNDLFSTFSLQQREKINNILDFVFVVLILLLLFNIIQSVLVIVSSLSPFSILSTILGIVAGISGLIFPILLLALVISIIFAAVAIVESMDKVIPTVLGIEDKIFKYFLPIVLLLVGLSFSVHYLGKLNFFQNFDFSFIMSSINFFIYVVAFLAFAPVIILFIKSVIEKVIIPNLSTVIPQEQLNIVYTFLFLVAVISIFVVFIEYFKLDTFGSSITSFLSSLIYIPISVIDKIVWIVVGILLIYAIVLAINYKIKR